MPPDDDADLAAKAGDLAAAEAKAKAEADKQGDKDVVPKSQFLAAIKSANDKYAALEAKLNAAIEAGQKKADPPKQYTRAELNAAVAANQISQEAADQLWDDQTEARILAKATEVSTISVTRAQRKERVDSDISRYTALEPEILVDGSDIREKIAKEFNFLVSMGDPKTPETELKALRAALGPIDQLELARSGRTVRDTHMETGDGGDRGGKKPGKNFQDALSAREKAHYQKGIDAGRYKNWDEVKAELQHANPNTRRKHGATV